MSDIVDLREYRQRRRAAEEHAAAKNRVRIEPDPDSPGSVQFRFSGPGFDSSDLVTTAEGARQFARDFAWAANEAERRCKPKCEFCGERACRRWHEGMYLECMGDLPPRTVAVIVRLCKKTARLRNVATGEEFYARIGSSMWRRRVHKLDVVE